MFYACHEHLDLAIDEYIEKYQEPPELFLVTQIKNSVGEGENICSFCIREAVYVVKEYAD